jgi:hypothetical protein
MGAVYAVRDLERDADVALKILLDERTTRLLAFKNEFRSLQDLTHRNLVRLDQLFEDDGRWFFTMELVRGLPFTSFVRPNGLDVERLRQSLTQLAEGLVVLHEAGKVHRDVKPSNTLIESSGRVVLLDFGLIGDLRSAGPDLLPRAGTAAYMAPERERERGGPAADWYSMGVMLYEALTGRLPFDGRSSTIEGRTLAGIPERPSRVVTDIEIPADLDQLAMDLLQRDPGFRPGPKDIFRHLERSHSPSVSRNRPDPASRSFVGRRHELALLRGAFESSDGVGGIVFVRGESGIGKTALMDAFLGELDDSVLAIGGRCYEREFVPFKALDGVVDSLARHLDNLDDEILRRLLPQRSTSLARIFPVLQQACRRTGLPLDGAEPNRPTEARDDAFRTLRELLANLAQVRPVILAIDDLHWADADSLTAIEDVLQGLLPSNLFVILVARAGTNAPRVSTKLTVIELGALAEDEARELADCLQKETPGARAADPGRLMEGAGRHPLFMEAMVRHSIAVGDTNVRLEDALVARLTDISPGARALTELVSIAAQPLSPVALAQASGLLAEPLFTLVRELQDNRLILTRGGETRPSVEPYHDQVRRAVVGCMSPDQQLGCHRRVAEALEVVTPDASEALAVHWRAAGEKVRARLHAIRAGHHARQVLAFDRAASFYQSALELASAADEQTGELHRWHAEALAHAGRTTESADAYRSAAGFASAHDQLDLLRCAAEQQLRAGHFDEGLSAMDGILRSLGMRRSQSMVSTALVLLQERLLEFAASILQRTLPLTRRRARELERRADACWTMALGLASLDPLASAVFQSRYLRISRRLGDRARLALGLCMRAPQGAFQGPPARRAFRILKRVEKITSGRTEPLIQGYQALAEAIIAFLVGRFDEALTQSERSLSLFLAHPGAATWEMATAEKYILDALWHTGQLTKLKERAWTAWREATRRGDRYLVLQIETALLPILHLIDDDLPAANAALETALGDWPRRTLSLPHWQHAQTQALVELYAGRPFEALRIMDAQVKATEQVLLSRIKAIRVFSWAIRASALVGAASKRESDKRHLLRRARKDMRRIQRENIAPFTVELLAGQIAFALGDTVDAGLHFAAAETLFADRGMRLFSLVAAFARGVTLGGEEGQTLMEQVRGRMRLEGIRSPDGFIRLFAPAIPV